MSSFTDSEKVQYALKYALNVTMQHKSLSAYAEERAPKRIFPSNIMSKDIISKGEGDLDADGNYLQGHVFNPLGTLTVAANISTPVTTVQYYKIVDPSINIVSNVTVNDILSNSDITGMSYDSIAALGDSSVDSNDPWYDKAVKIQQLQKAWFFRGHYGGAASEGDMFSHATSNYNGLYLAYNKIAAGTVVDVTDATKIVPHIKLYLQVQTENIATGSDGTGDVDNMSFRHSLLENMLGLESGFANVVPVQGPHYTSSSSEKMPIIQTGIMGNEWYSQDTYGMLSFYALGSGSHTVADNYPDPSTPHGTSSPLVSYLRYIGETAATTGIGGGGSGSGGGGGTVSTVGLGGTFMGDQLVSVDASGLEIMLNATNGTAIGDGEFNVYTDIDLRGGSTLLLDGVPAVFSNWTEDSNNNISRDSDVTVTGDLQLNGTLKDASGNARIFSNWVEDASNNISRDSDVTVTGDLQLNGTLKDASGNARIFSNWGISGENIYRESKVGIGMNNPLHALDISGDLNIVGNVTVNSINATESFDYIAPINQLQDVDEEPSWTGNVSTSIGFDELVDANIPESLDTLKEIAELVKDISNSNALTAGLGLKANKASPIFTGNVGIGQVANVSYALDILGDVNISSGALKLNGSTPVYSNWEVSGDDIFRDSGVTIGQNSVNNTSYKLYVNGNTHINGTLSATTLDGNLEWSKIQNPPTTIATSQTNAIVANTAKVSSQWITGSSSKIYYNSGNVGIGTTDPGIHRLHVMGTKSAPMHGQALKVSTDGACWLELEGKNTGGSVEGWGISSHQDGGLKFYKRAGTGGVGYRMTITGSGNVGIGTTSPDHKLEIYESSGFVRLCIESGSGGKLLLGTHNDGRVFLWNEKNSYLHFGTNNSERMRIDNEGNVGIGTTNPDSKLHVISTNIFDGIRVEYSDSNPAGVYIGYGGISSIGNTRLRLGANNTEHMCIDETGNVGIGTTSPEYKLDLAPYNFVGISPVESDAKYIRFICANGPQNNNNGTTSSGGLIWKTNYGAGYTKTSAKIIAVGTGNFFRGSLAFYTNGVADNTTDATEKMRIHENGYVGIGTDNPRVSLEVTGSNNWGAYTAFLNVDGASTGNGTTTNLCIFGDYGIGTDYAFYIVSDERIKKNIVDVPDNLALQQVRNIPCRYYEYKDYNKKGTGQTIGFIAQEVREILPMAVTIETNFIPNEMRGLENISWEEIIDGSNNTYKLTTDLQDVSGIKYRFYVSDDTSGNDEKTKDIIGNNDNTFTFDKSYNIIFCYGKEVDDFHMLDKQKLFALNFSATQELDRKVTKLEAENHELSKKVDTLEVKNTIIKQENEDLKFQMALLRSELMTIKAHLGI